MQLRYIISVVMDQPQPCTKCKKLPEDILMLACSHDLCLDCASERLAFEMKKKKNANVPPSPSRASSAKYAMNALRSMRKAFLNSRSSSPSPRLPSPDPMQSQGRPTIGPKELFRSRRWCPRTSRARARATRGSRCENMRTGARVAG